MNNTVNLDIIIPTLNEGKRLNKLIPYLIDNISSDCKLFIVDSVHSTDDSQSICLKHDINYLKSNYKRRSSQMNEGAKSGNGDVVMFLHADVIPPTNFLSLISESIAEGYKAGFFSYKFDSPSLLLKINAFFTKFDGIFAGGGDQCQFFSRELFEKYKGYSEDYEIMEDFEFIERLRNNDISYKIIDKPATVSARKYKNNSYLRVNIINLITFIKYKSKINNHELSAYYKKSLK